MCKFLWNVFIFTSAHIVFKHNIQTPLFKHISNPPHPTIFLLTALFSLLLHVPALYFLSILSNVSVLSECRHLPMLVVMILSVRLVSCQTHRIYSGLFPLLTLMFLFFTRKEENGSVLELLSTNTVYELLSNQGKSLIGQWKYFFVMTAMLSVSPTVLLQYIIIINSYFHMSQLTEEN